MKFRTIPLEYGRLRVSAEDGGPRAGMEAWWRCGIRFEGPEVGGDTELNVWRRHVASPLFWVCVAHAADAHGAFPTNRARHVFGPLEKSEIRFTPEAMRDAVTIVGSVPKNGRIEKKERMLLTMGEEVSSFSLDVRCGAASLPLAFSVLNPATVEAVAVERLSLDDFESLRRAARAG
ncbi:MAG: hypothetical protein ACI4RA_03050 [Kiritimatiellia bacterium]